MEYSIDATNVVALPSWNPLPFLGGVHQREIANCFRYRPAARQPQMIVTGMAHIGCGASSGKDARSAPALAALSWHRCVASRVPRLASRADSPIISVIMLF
jgi:hypothetical protein